MEHRFDTLSRTLGAQQSRRGLLKQFGAALVVGVVAAVRPRGLRALTPCEPGLVFCAGACADVLSDPGNCGGCGTPAPPGGTCANGVAFPPPNSGGSAPPPSSDSGAANSTS